MTTLEEQVEIEREKAKIISLLDRIQRFNNYLNIGEIEIDGIPIIWIIDEVSLLLVYLKKNPKKELLYLPELYYYEVELNNIIDELRKVIK
jgi:hypothetical protein